MEDKVYQRLNLIRMISENDREYHKMLMEIRELEKKYECILQELSYEQRDDLCDFVSMCEEMSHRMLEIACTYMRFPD